MHHNGGPGPLQVIHHGQSLMLQDHINSLDSGTQATNPQLSTAQILTATATVNTTQSPPIIDNTPRSLISTVNTPRSLTTIIDTPQSHIAVIDPQPLAAIVNAAQPQLPTIDPLPVVNTLPQFQPNIFKPHNPPINDHNGDYMQLDYEGGEANVDRGDDIRAEIAASKKKKPNERKNQYYGNRTQPQHLWAKSTPKIVEEVDQTIRGDPKLGQSDRISLLNSRRQQQWRELPEGEQAKWINTANEINSQTPDFGDTAYVHTSPLACYLL